MQSKMISSFIREERINQDLTQNELARKASVSARSISAIELEEPVRKSTVEKVMSALGYKLVVRYDFEKLKK